MTGLGRRSWKEAFALMGRQLRWRVQVFAVLAVAVAIIYAILRKLTGTW